MLKSSRCVKKYSIGRRNTCVAVILYVLNVLNDSLNIFYATAVFAFVIFVFLLSILLESTCRRHVSGSN